MEIRDKTTRNRVLAVLFFSALMGALDIAVVGPALILFAAAWWLKGNAEAAPASGLEHPASIDLSSDP
jgi:hypothetical protein